MRSNRIPILFLLGFLALFPAGYGQSGKPVIIRDTDIAEGVYEDVVPAPRERNPNEARKNIEVGNYYHKKKNYVGAILRYLTAIEYQPDSDKAHEALIKTLTSINKVYKSKKLTQDEHLKLEEKHGQISVAVHAFEEFLRTYPDSIENYDDYRNMVAELKELSIKKYIDLGNFDFERKHYVKAILRYLTAIRQQPGSTMAYESIVRANQSLVAAYESVNPTQDAYDTAKRDYGDISDVAIAFKNLVRENPDTINADGFVAMIEKLEEVSSRFDNL